MSKYVADSYLDKIADALLADVTHIHMVSDAETPAGITNSLGSVAVSGGDFNKADGDVSGRKVTLASKNITANADGQKRHIVGWTGSVVAFATPVTVESIANANIYEIPAIDIIEVRDPS